MWRTRWTRRAAARPALQPPAVPPPCGTVHKDPPAAAGSSWCEFLKYLPAVHPSVTPLGAPPKPPPPPVPPSPPSADCEFVKVRAGAGGAGGATCATGKSAADCEFVKDIDFHPETVLASRPCKDQVTKLVAAGADAGCAAAAAAAAADAKSRTRAAGCAVGRPVASPLVLYIYIQKPVVNSSSISLLLTLRLRCLSAGRRPLLPEGTHAGAGAEGGGAAGTAGTAAGHPGCAAVLIPPSSPSNHSKAKKDIAGGNYSRPGRVACKPKADYCRQYADKITKGSPL